MPSTTNVAPSDRPIRQKKKETRNEILEALLGEQGTATALGDARRRAERSLERLDREYERRGHYMDDYHKRWAWTQKKRDATARVEGLKTFLAPVVAKVAKLEAKLREIDPETRHARAAAARTSTSVKTGLSSEKTKSQDPTSIHPPSGTTTTTQQKKKPTTPRQLAPELQERSVASREHGGATAQPGLGATTREKSQAQNGEAYEGQGVTVRLRRDLGAGELPGPEDIREAAAGAQGRRCRREGPRLVRVEGVRAGQRGSGGGRREGGWDREVAVVTGEEREVSWDREATVVTGEKRTVSRDDEATMITSKKRKVSTSAEENPPAATGSAERTRGDDTPVTRIEATAPASEHDDSDDEPPIKRTRRAAPAFRTLMGETAPAATKRRAGADEADRAAQKRAEVPAPAAGRGAERTTFERQEEKETQEAARKKLVIRNLRPAYYPKPSHDLPPARDHLPPGDDAAPGVTITTLHVSDLPARATEAWIWDLLRDYGYGGDVVEGVRVRWSSGAPYAFVKFRRCREARDAMGRLDGVWVGRGRRLRVEKAREETRGFGRR